MNAAPTSLIGVLNVTPDSFSDGAKYIDTQKAVAHALKLVREGAAIIDVGGESTRPGAKLVGAAEEKSRAIPVITELAKHGVTVSIDTIRSETARAAAQAGATIINDVSGGTFDEKMFVTVAELSKERDIKYIIGHWRGVPDPQNSRSNYADVTAEIAEFLAEQAAKAVAAGIAKDNIVLDPGLGFDKNSAQSWTLLQNISEIQKLGYPVCVGVSRKRMLAEIVQNTTGSAGEFEDRDLATSLVTAFAARANVNYVRVHDVLGSAQALEVTKLWPARAVPAVAVAGAAVPDPEFKKVGSQIQASQPASALKINGRDIIKLTGLEVFAHHGVFDFERENGQKFIIDIEVITDMTPAISGDALAETVHYGELADKVLDAAQKDPVDLIETLADRVARVALGFNATKEVTVTIHKPDAPIDATFADVSVSITRGRS